MAGTWYWLVFVAACVLLILAAPLCAWLERRDDEAFEDFIQERLGSGRAARKGGKIVVRR